MDELMAVSNECVSGANSIDEIPDLSLLLEYGDRTAILDRLIAETKKDMQAVKEAGEKRDRKALDEWAHRLRSSWAVIRADKPLWNLYELLHQDQECSEEELQRAVTAVLEKGNEIINIAQKERRKPDESVCD